MFSLLAAACNSSDDELVILRCPEATEQHTLLRGPYVQTLTPTEVTLRWRTTDAMPSHVLYRAAGSSTMREASAPATKEHTLRLTGLKPAKRYTYEICGNLQFAPEPDWLHFTTAPDGDQDGTARIWVIGDSGSATLIARQVFDDYLNDTGEMHTDAWLMLGDNAYQDGTDREYQLAVFDMYNELLPNTALWPVLGNHDARSVDTATETGAYYDIFTLPKEGQAGGVASGKEAYYSYDYGNIHFVALDSQDSDRSLEGAMLQWLEDDLAANDKLWTIAYMHHPPYTKGSHDSDAESQHIDVRENIVPILERYDVDLVLAGHSHLYERSYLTTGHYGYSQDFDPAVHRVQDHDGNPVSQRLYTKSRTKTAGAGTIYSVVGSSGTIGGGAADHPALPIAYHEFGSMVLEIADTQLDAKFIGLPGEILDQFRIVKE